MELGLLWYDDDPKKTLERKISEAAERYRQRFGRLPNVCRVNHSLAGAACPKDGSEGDRTHWVTLQLSSPGRIEQARIALLPDRAISPHYFWLGNAPNTQIRADERGMESRPIASLPARAPARR